MQTPNEITTSSGFKLSYIPSFHSRLAEAKSEKTSLEAIESKLNAAKLRKIGRRSFLPARSRQDKTKMRVDSSNDMMQTNK